MKILTHRGLDPSRTDFYSESTLEAFKNHLERGYGLELDVNFTRDGIVIFHDSSLKRQTRGADARVLTELTTQDALAVKLSKGRLGTLAELAQVAQNHPSQKIALHFKGGLQKEHYTTRLLDALKKWPTPTSDLLLFDLLPTTAMFVKERMPELNLGAAIAHPYDVVRYNSAVHGTLMTVDDFLKLPKGLYATAWLDEWDLSAPLENGQIDPNGKKLYTSDLMNVLRQNGFEIALVTPELHGTSPGLFAN